MDLFYKVSLIPGSILGIFYLYKSYFGVPKYKGDEDLTGKVVIITGGSSGIGKELAFRLAMRQATLIIGCRNINKCKEARKKIFLKSNNKNVYCSELDLESFDSIDNFVKRLSDKFEKVDILINNAGYKSGDTREITKTFIEKQLAINFFGSHLLTKRLIPLLSTSEAARVLYLVCPQYKNGSINMSDINCGKNYDKYKSFSQSQLMRMLSMRYFANKFLPTQISFNACDPGAVYTNFHNRCNYNNNIISRFLFKYINSIILRGAWQAPETPVMCCVSNELNNVTGQLYRDLKQLEINENALDSSMMQFVDLLCEKWTDPSNTKLLIK